MLNDIERKLISISSIESMPEVMEIYDLITKHNYTMAEAIKTVISNDNRNFGDIKIKKIKNSDIMDAVFKKIQNNYDKLDEKFVKIYNTRYKIKAKVESRYSPHATNKTKNMLFLKPKNHKNVSIPDVTIIYNIELGTYEFDSYTGKAPNHTSGVSGRITKNDKFKYKPLEYFKSFLTAHDNDYKRNNK